MRRTKPDRWERLVMETARRLNAKKETAGFRCEGCLENQEVAKLLRREHRAVERWAKDKAKLGFWDAGYQDGYHAAITNLLDWLHARAQ